MDQVVMKNVDEKFCSECGSVIKIKAEICPKCGVRQIAAPSALGGTTPSGKTKVAAALFGIFLGGIGGHKFYLGQTIQGFFYLIFCWTFIPLVFGFIEGLNYLTMSDKVFAERYGRI